MDQCTFVGSACRSEAERAPITLVGGGWGLAVDEGPGGSRLHPARLEQEKRAEWALIVSDLVKNHFTSGPA